MNCNCNVDTTLEQVEQSYIAAVKTAAEKAMQAENINGEIELVLVDNSYIKDLNSRYRGINSETDVLSFPANDLEEPLCCALEKGFAVEKGETAEIALGDIYISVEKAIKQGSFYGNSPEEELGFLAVHGALHLMGYDHIEKEDEVIMRERQRKILGRAAE